jgi:hypothetical protein
MHAFLQGVGNALDGQFLRGLGHEGRTATGPGAAPIVQRPRAAGMVASVTGAEAGRAGGRGSAAHLAGGRRMAFSRAAWAAAS